MKYYFLSFLNIFLLYACSNQKKTQNDTSQNTYNWENLIDSELSNWDTYLSYQHKVGYNGAQPKDENGNEIAPIGLNHPDYNVFSTFKEGEDLIIKNTGEYYGCLITKKDYKNYHFQLKYKWGNKTWAYRKDLLKDSGILYHSTGPMGAEYWRSWMLSQEFQIMEGHTGDFWCQANSAIDIRAYKPEYIIDPLAHESQDYITLKTNSPYGGYCRRSNNYEQPNDKWNTLDLYCYEGKSLHVVNGEVVMILKNSRYIKEDGSEIPLIEGKIQLQSEAAEVFFKDIRIREIDALTTEQQHLF